MSGLDQPIVIANSCYHVVMHPELEEQGADLLRSGQVTFYPAPGREARALMSEGYPLVLDTEVFYKSQGPWPPGKVIVATRQTIEQRAEELSAFLRANLRGYWFVQDSKNHAFMFELETRLREDIYNAYERKLRMLDTPSESMMCSKTRHRSRPTISSSPAA